MISKNFVFAIQALDGGEKTLEFFRTFTARQIRCFITYLLVNLRQCRSAQAISAHS